MKGLMATLLILSCTGMVHAQREYNDNGFRPRNGTGGALADRNNSDAPVVPIVNPQGASGDQASTATDPNARTRSPFGSSQDRDNTPRSSTMLNPQPVARKSFPERDSGVMRRPVTSPANPAGNDVIYLGLPAAEVAGLLQDGSVEAPVADPFVDRITISDQNRPSSNPVRRIQPVLRDKKLVFRFTQEELSRLGDYSFEFEVPDYMKGQYNKAVIEYPPALERIANASTTRQGNGTGFSSDDSRWKFPADRTTRQPVTDLYEQQQQQRQALLNRQREADRLREEDRQRLAYEKFLKEKAAREKLDLADQNRKLQEQIDRMQFQQQRDAALANQGTTWPLPGNRFADRNFDPTFSGARPVAPPASDTLTVSMMQQMQQMQTRFAQLESENRRLGNEVQSVKSDRDTLRRRFDIDNEYRRDLANHRPDVTPADRNIDTAPTLPDRRPVISTGGFDLNDRTKGQQASTGFKKPLGTENDRGPFDLLMFMMLLGSVALNVYLWAVSRGFYMRYQELADELRETFAVTA